jgi:hypothetical protein
LEQLEDRCVPAITGATLAFTAPVVAGTYSGPVATFTDANNPLPQNVTAVINWGDNTSASNGTVVALAGTSRSSFKACRRKSEEDSTGT